MIVVVVIAILAAVGFPSYREHVARGQRSQGQQFLSELAQRNEQFLLDRRQYAANVPALNVTPPTGIKYDVPNVAYAVDNGANPPTFAICLSPLAGSNLATRGDGAVCINNQGQRWRQPTTGTPNTAFDAGECMWDDRGCKITGES
jgi:type IV pilus assembly protein PilE